MNSLTSISAIQILEVLNAEDRVNLFIEFFKKNPYEYAIINEKIMSKKDCWDPLEFVIVVFSGRIGANNRYDVKKTGFFGSFKTVVEESLETMLIYKYKTYMSNKAGGMMTNWKTIYYRHGNLQDDNPILKESKFYFGDNSVTFVPVDDAFKNMYIEIPYKDEWIQPSHENPIYGYPYKEYDAKIYTIEDYTQKIVPILQHIWPILDKFYCDVIMNPDLNNFNFNFDGVLYTPQKHDTC